MIATLWRHVPNFSGASSELSVLSKLGPSEMRRGTLKGPTKEHKKAAGIALTMKCCEDDGAQEEKVTQVFFVELYSLIK